MPTYYANPFNLLSKNNQILTQAKGEVSSLTLPYVTNYENSSFFIASDVSSRYTENVEYTIAELKNGNKLIFKWWRNGNYYWASYLWFDPYGTQLAGWAGSTWQQSSFNSWHFDCIILYEENVVISSPNPSSSSYQWSVNTGKAHTLVDGAEVPADPYFFAPDNAPAGGYGDFDYSGDEIDFDALPTISVADSGFVTLFNPTETQLKSLAQYMWSGLFDIATFRKIFADPMDCIIGLSIVPVTPPTGTAKELKVGNVGTGLSFNPLTSQFVEVDFNPLNIGLRTNSFMDFAPYTKCQIYLPFCGTFSLSVDDVCDADLILKYKIDLFTGACTASIKVVKTNSDGAQLKSVLYQFSGNVSANIPFTSTNYNGFLQGILGAVGMVAGIATGGAGITAAGAVSAINGAMSMKPEIERSGNLAATSGFLGKQKPYLIMQYPHLCKPSGRDKTVGTPSFIGLSENKKLNSYHGLTSLHRVNVKGIPCTEDERLMIESALLTEGVILP